MNLRDKTAVLAVIKRRHWAGGESIAAIERSLGIGKSVLSFWCKRHGIAVRTKEAQCSITNSDITLKPRGAKHWAWGRRKETDTWAAIHSDRMLKHNPMTVESLREKASRSLALLYRDTPTDAEAVMLKILARCSVAFVFQHCVGKYIIDFAFPAQMLGLEIDGKGHARRRTTHDIPRDGWLIEQGWKIIRVRQDNLSVALHLLTVLKQYVPDLQIPSNTPTMRRQYRVLIRDSDNPSGRKV